MIFLIRLTASILIVVVMCCLTAAFAITAGVIAVPAMLVNWWRHSAPRVRYWWRYGKWL